MSPIIPGIFHNEWLVPSVEPVNTIVWRLSDDAQAAILEADYTAHMLSIKQREAIVKLSYSMGSNPYVALSGGIDSQAACILLTQCGVKFTAAIMVFGNNLNAHDVDSAIAFCGLYCIPYVTIQFDILEFLTRTLPSYVDKYDCPSPQLLTHCRLYEILIEQFKPSCIIGGGNPPCIRDGTWEFISSRSHSVWMNFGKIHNFPLIGNFLGYSLEIALPFMLLQPDMSMDLGQRYKAKVEGMHRLGIRVIPQQQKYTGFELVKKYFADLTGDGWTFEKSFRLPFHIKRPEYDSILQLTAEIHEFLTDRHCALK